MHDHEALSRLGFMQRQGGVHASRTIMLNELAALFDSVPSEAPASAYRAAIREQNCLGKRSGRTRDLTARHLAELYGLDPANPIHVGLRFFWSRDKAAHPQLALLAAAARDSLLRGLLPAILEVTPGTLVSRDWVEQLIEVRWPERFSPATRRSVAQNINSSLTKAGYMSGRVKKFRRQLEPATGAVAFALYLGWIQGGRGELLLQSEYLKLLDSGADRLLELAAQASSRGWLVMRRVDNVMDVDFPALAPVAEAAIKPESDTATEGATP
ncbi:hypothetical protein R5M92_12810 [Halomonas sp. Bachu 37]|uniref:hypothetical protein n=1 Tax=Halomonas kashgarensis TaxID=3084920 RepID=UPI0032162AB1